MSPSARPTSVAELKQAGNDCYKRGQYGQAAVYYSEAIKKLEASGKSGREQLSILYSNRAAAFIKDGQCSECIKDCTVALEMVPYEVKPLMRRATAYESLERYSMAYVDYKTALQVDNGVQAAHDGTNRMTKALMEQYGPGWREKLPKIPSVPLSAQKNWQSPSPVNVSADENKKASELQKDSKRLQSTGATPEAKAHAKALKEEGNAFVKQGDFKKAVEKYTASLQLDSSECTTYTNRALCYLSLKQYRAVVEDCKEALRLDPKNVKGLYRRAQALKELKVT
ncbi:mitochondrial import receptor subunit TOM34 [Protopterus annectens]|uniref:mitochondrial import receptor subunit TOM34 n=1 Tax=Protopterus annectens TaxID=7888 RepID=UPI001CF9C063|nr:mitochondrial import receptor subunit TOM34 [Protopterus annectens]